VSDPLRGGPAFAATANVIVAEPTPDAGFAPPIQFASLSTDHEQASVAVSPSETSWLFSSRFTADGNAA